jgi:inorganic pyrophosphatase
VSRAPLDKLKAFRHRMGWGFTRMSSGETDFNYDHHASFTPQQRERYGGLRRLVGRPRHATPDRDLLDAPLLSEPTFPGCLIRSRAICMLLITDRKGPGDKVLCL